MRFMLVVRANGYLEAGISHTRRFEDAMAEYRKTLAQAGILLAAEELQPSASGIRIRHSGSGGSPEVRPGPFPMDPQLIAGYVVIDAATAAEAVEWALKMLVPEGSGDGEVEVRELRESVRDDLHPRIQALEADLKDQLHMLNQMARRL